MTDDARRLRAALRRPRATLTTTTPDRSAPPAPATPLERLALMWPLALDAWHLAGRPLPDYRREDMPGRVIRPGDPPREWER